VPNVLNVVSDLEVAMGTELLDLLEQAGTIVHSRRGDCPRCKRRRSVSIDPEQGLFMCHGFNCDFHGNIKTLQRWLGIEREWLPRGEYIRRRGQERRADAMAPHLYSRLQSRRLELLNELRAFDRLEMKAHEAGPDHPATWGALAVVYRQRPEVEAALDWLERTNARELVHFFSSE
jgi:hypothetical protein